MSAQDLDKLRRAARKVDRLERELDAARSELRRLALNAHRGGESIAEIARTLGVSRQRIYQMIDRG